MIKNTQFPRDLIFDIETAPDLAVARRVYPGLRDKDDADATRNLYHHAGGTDENPRPFLKYLFHRVVSIVAIMRQRVPITAENPAGIELSWHRFPGDDLERTEAEILGDFLGRVGERKPRVIGWNSVSFDLPCLTQRALINRLVLPKFSTRPAKPWEGIDYFAKGSDYNLDLMDVVASNSPGAKCTLNEFACALRIPGKLGVAGDDVGSMYAEGRLAEIVAYNETDVASTYLIWLEVLRMSGHVTENNYLFERGMFREILETRAAAGATHFDAYLAEWDALQD